MGSWQISKKEPPIIFCITRTITYATSNLFSVRSPRGLVISFVSLFGAAQIWEKWLLLSRLAATVKTTKHMLALFREKWQVNLRSTIRTGGASRKKTRKSNGSCYEEFSGGTKGKLLDLQGY